MSIARLERLTAAFFMFSTSLGMGFLFTFVIKRDLVLLVDLLMITLYGLWFYRTNGFAGQKLVLKPFGLLALLMMFWATVSLIPAKALQATAIGVFLIIKAFLAYFYFINNIKTRQTLLLMVNMLMLTLLFQGFVSVAQKTLGRPLGLSFLGEKITNLGKDLSRMRGTLGFPNQYGAFVILLLPMAISLSVFVKRSWYKVFLIVTTSFGLAGLFLSLSRSSWAGFLLGMVCFTFIMFRRGLLKPKFIVAIVVMIAVVAGVAFANMDTIEARFESGADGSWRELMVGISIPMIKDNPVFGVGLFNYQYHSFHIFKFWHPVHNTFLRLASETGILGALLFIITIIVVLKESYKMAMKNDGLLSAVATGVFCGYVAFVVAINFGPQYQHYRIKLLFFILAAFAFAMPRIQWYEKKKVQWQHRKRMAAQQKNGVNEDRQPNIVSNHAGEMRI